MPHTFEVGFRLGFATIVALNLAEAAAHCLIVAWMWHKQHRMEV